LTGQSQRAGRHQTQIMILADHRHDHRRFDPGTKWAELAQQPNWTAFAIRQFGVATNSIAQE
jgi:hypothetical protein